MFDVTTDHDVLADGSLRALDASGFARVQQQALVALAAQMEWPLTLKHADDGRYLVANEAFATLVMRPLSQVAGADDGALFSPATAAALRSADQSAVHVTMLRGGDEPGVSAGEQRLDIGGVRREFMMLRAAGRADGRPIVLTVWQDLTAVRERELQSRQWVEQLEQHQAANAALRRELAEHAMRDAASGLNTRAQFDDHLRREIDLSQREQRAFALVTIAVDSPTPALGDARALDRIVEALGRLLRSNTRAMDASCHDGEGRFHVLLSGVGLATAHSRMEGLRRQCATQIVLLDGQRLAFTVSMGVASFPHTADALEALRTASASALAQARQRGGNAVALAPIRFEAKGV